MAGEATIAQSDAILKTRYKDGKPPKVHFQNFKFFSTLKKREDFTGANKVFSLQTEDPQAASVDFTQMVTVFQQGSYSKFTVTPVNFYTAARVRGDAIKRASGDEGSMVNLWKNETDGASQTSIKMHEIYSLRNGTGVLGTIDGASNVGTASVTLATPSDAANFDLGASYSLVDSATSLSPTLRNSGAVVKLTGIDRVLGVLTFSGNVTASIAAAANTDSFVRIGTSASAGVPRVHTGVQLWIAGGTNPSALFGCTRNVDPVRLAGQVWDATGVGMEDALIEAESMLDVQGQLSGDLVAWVHPLDVKELKKSQLGKVTYPKAELKSFVPNLSFSGFEIDGTMGKIKLMTNPFQPKGEVLMVDMSDLAFESAGPAPHLQDYDQLRSIRITTDDVYQVSFASYGQLFDYRPSRGIRIQNWGAT